MNDPFLEQTRPQQQAFFDRHGPLLARLVGETQAPRALFITCSDARLVPEQLLDARPGDLFMLRTVANIVPPYTQVEIGVASALEFAVCRLEVPRIVVCGHTDCGGILALEEPPDLAREPALARWLELARPALVAVDLRQERLPAEERQRRIVAENVRRQLGHLASYPFVRQRLAAGTLSLHGWLYDLAVPSLEEVEV